MRDVRDISDSERQLILQEYRDQTAKEVGQKHGLTEIQVKGMAYRTGLRKPQGKKPGQVNKATPLEARVKRMINRTFIYNCQFRTIKGFEIKEQELKLITTTKTILLPLNKANSILTNQFLQMSGK